MSQATKVILLLASFVPVLAVHVLAFVLLSQPVDGGSWVNDHLGALVLALVATQYGIAAFFTWHLKSRSSAPREKHLDWILQFFFLPSPVGVVGYWYRHIWSDSRRAV